MLLSDLFSVLNLLWLLSTFMTVAMLVRNKRHVTLFPQYSFHFALLFSGDNKIQDSGTRDWHFKYGKREEEY